mgnify:CR=1 FL=1
MRRDMRIRFSGRDLHMLEELASLRGEHPRLLIKLLIEEAYAADKPSMLAMMEEASDAKKSEVDQSKLDDELPF